MIAPPPPRLPIRLVNLVGPNLDSVHGRGTLDEAVMHERAIQRARCDDFGPDDYREGLTRLCESARTEAQLSFAGNVGLEDEIVNALTTRLLLAKARKQGRLSDGAPLNKPLIIVGLPRSGTTHLHRLLALDPTARALRTWEIREPLPPPGPDLRRWKTRALVTALRLAAPGLDAKHKVDADQPEECVYLLDSSLRSDAFWIMAPVYGYIDWLLEQDMRPAYATYRELLTLFQQQTPGRRLTLKAPAHTYSIPTLKAVLPEALLVQTHRDPVPIISSVNSLTLSLHGGMTETLDVGRMARANLDQLSVMAHRSVEARSLLPDGDLVDVQYADLVRNPVAEVRRIYEHFELPYGPELHRRLQEALAVRTQHRYGRHAYCAEDFEMTDDGIAAHFEGYRRRFLA